MAGTREEAVTRRRQYRQQIQQQQAQRPRFPAVRELPAKEQQSRHNPVAEILEGPIGETDQ
jgi:hypothetical protein